MNRECSPKKTQVEKKTLWQTFRDQFNSSIHSNEDLSDVNKFNDLHSFVCDEAREMIS